SQGGSNHTLFPSARKERSKPCGIFARKLTWLFEGNGDGGESRMFGGLSALRWRSPQSVVIQANLTGKSAVLPVSGQSGRGLVLYLALAQLKVP
ncbi:hypothetical protein, partial [Mesorhizobium sp. M8A.F.Ca.ET.021.01.1.1]|uniref:hypothetical protein n=1 Tax=Mesorhizobium sp. M8A.F.Ca.ET.021.01.1.1 TaxID=2496757 RepID=UPI001AED0D24